MEFQLLADQLFSPLNELALVLSDSLNKFIFFEFLFANLRA